MRVTVPSIDEIGDLSRYSVDQLVDMIGELKRYQKHTEKVTGYLLEGLKARLPEGEFDGERFRVVLKSQTQSRLDTPRVKQEMGADWYTDHSKTIEMRVARFYVREAENYVEL